MEIVNFIKDSTVECSPFSWGLTLFSFGCNLHCKMCEGYNYEKVTERKNIKGNAIDIIKNNITPLHDCVVFIGGEPTIWEDKLEEALIYCHSLGLKTKIFSNGVLSSEVEKINSLGLCDAWSIDFKGLTNLKEQINLENDKYLYNVDKTLKNIIKHSLPLEIRTTFHSGNELERQKVVETVKKTYIKSYKEKNPSIPITYIEQEDVRNIV